MASDSAYHVIPSESGEWAVRGEGDSRASSIHPTQAQAVAGAWELAKDRGLVEVIVHGDDGRIRSSLTIRQVDDPEDVALCREAERLTPGIDVLLRMAQQPSADGADLDADPGDLY